MIIEIKDLPSDRKVKHITFDITFEEDGTPIVKTMPIVPHQHVQTIPVTSNLNFPSTPEGPNPRSIETRPQKDIPPEMTNVEF
jgi:hypothetical protein